MWNMFDVTPLVTHKKVRYIIFICPLFFIGEGGSQAQLLVSRCVEPNLILGSA